MSAVLDKLPSIAAAEEVLRRRKRQLMRTYFPDSGDRSRVHYPKQIEFFKAGQQYGERLFMAANRIGKSDAGAYECALHATGLYPDWWEGRRFSEPVEIWACGTNSETTRDIVQRKLFGPIEAVGTGMIPGDLITNPTKRSGVPNALEGARIKHVSGGYSEVNLKTYEQGRGSFEGTAKHVVWDDEEPPLDVYTEQLLRTATTKGIVFTTFTPLQGMSDVVKSFLEPESEDAKLYKWHIQAGWDDVPHLDPEEMRRLKATMPPYQVDARTKGVPSLGVGAIYPISEEDITCADFVPHETWPRVYALDVGWRRTACLWAAKDPGSGVMYLYSEHYQGQGEPASHALAIKGRGDWIPGVIDPASSGSNQIDGRSVRSLYNALGLNLMDADNTVDGGITTVWQMLVSGQLKVMASLRNWFSEFRKYHRDDKGKIVKQDDHLMDCTRYLMMTGRHRMASKPKPKHEQPIRPSYATYMGS